jgi:sugar lactone lactonase YvrE
MAMVKELGVMEQVLDRATGKVVRRVGEDQLRHPWGLVLEPDGTLIVTDSADHRLLAFV